MWGQLGSHGCFMATVIGSIVRQNESECELSVADMRRLTGTRDSKTSRCTIGTRGLQELMDAGVLERTGNSNEYRVVMPESAGTSHVQGTCHVPQRTSHVPAGTSHVPKRTCHVPRIKEVERERIPEKTQSACVREIADKLLEKYPATRRCAPGQFALYFWRTVQAWAVRHGVGEDRAAELVRERADAHIEAHRANGDEDRFFPFPRKFFDERIEADPPEVKGVKRGPSDEEVAAWWDGLDATDRATAIREARESHRDLIRHSTDKRRAAIRIAYRLARGRQPPAVGREAMKATG